MRTLRDTIEFLTFHDGDQPRATMEELLADLRRKLEQEESIMRKLDAPCPDDDDSGPNRLSPFGV